ncbi:MAG: heavy-metal-associated domain-containing protein [Deltaproteobacteria bacterium]|nr:heavy-metal-associated domain-containing protein [Deltaproteobacteria bacterium]
MTCQHCVATVYKVLSKLDGIKNIDVDLETGIVTFEEVKPVDMDLLRTRISEAGYEVG